MSTEKTVYRFVYKCPYCGKLTPMKYMVSSSSGGDVPLECKRCHEDVLIVRHHNDGSAHYYKVWNNHKNKWILGTKTGYASRDIFWAWCLDRFGKRTSESL